MGKHCIIMSDQHIYLTVIMNSISSNYKNTTNWRGHCNKLVSIVRQILTNENHKHDLSKTS